MNEPLYYRVRAACRVDEFCRVLRELASLEADPDVIAKRDSTDVVSTLPDASRIMKSMHVVGIPASMIACDEEGTAIDGIDLLYRVVDDLQLVASDVTLVTEQGEWHRATNSYNPWRATDNSVMSDLTMSGMIANGFAAFAPAKR